MPGGPSRQYPWLAGPIADLPTPFDRHGALDEAAFRLLCEWQVEAGAKAILVGETAGEFSTLTGGEQQLLVRIAVEAVAGRAAVLAGAGSNATAKAVEYTRRAQDSGASAVVSATPYYNKPPQSGLLAHFDAVAAESNVPVVIHDAPRRCVVSLSDDTVVRLAAMPQIVGLADGSGDVGRIARLRFVLGDDFRLLSADEPTAASFLMHGGDGSLSLAANLVPRLCRSLHEANQRRNLRTAVAISEQLTPLVAALHQDCGAAAVKHALAKFFPVGILVRLPLTELLPPARMALDLAMMGLPADALPPPRGTASRCGSMTSRSTKSR